MENHCWAVQIIAAVLGQKASWCDETESVKLPFFQLLWKGLVYGVSLL